MNGRLSEAWARVFTKTKKIPVGSAPGNSKEKGVSQTCRRGKEQQSQEEERVFDSYGGGGRVVLVWGKGKGKATGCGGVSELARGYCAKKGERKKWEKRPVRGGGLRNKEKGRALKKMGWDRSN